MIETSHWPLIVAAYALSFGAIGLLAVSTWWTGRRRAADLARLEAAAPRLRARDDRSRP